MMKFLKGFGFAWNGIFLCLREERHFRIHLAFVLYVSLLSGYFDLSRGEWAVLVLVMGLVLVAEAVNTALERIVNLVSPAYHPLAKAAKDVAAGSVLLAALVSVAVAVCLLTKSEGWQAMLCDFSAHIWKPIVLGFSVIPAGWLAFRSYPHKNSKK